MKLMRRLKEDIYSIMTKMAPTTSAVEEVPAQVAQSDANYPATPNRYSQLRRISAELEPVPYNPPGPVLTAFQELKDSIDSLMVYSKYRDIPDSDPNKKCPKRARRPSPSSRRSRIGRVSSLNLSLAGAQEPKRARIDENTEATTPTTQDNKFQVCPRTPKKISPRARSPSPPTPPPTTPTSAIELSNECPWAPKRVSITRGSDLAPIPLNLDLLPAPAHQVQAQSLVEQTSVQQLSALYDENGVLFPPEPVDEPNKKCPPAPRRAHTLLRNTKKPEILKSDDPEDTRRAVMHLLSQPAGSPRSHHGAKCYFICHDQFAKRGFGPAPAPSDSEDPSYERFFSLREYHQKLVHVIGYVPEHETAVIGGFRKRMEALNSESTLQNEIQKTDDWTYDLACVQK